MAEGIAMDCLNSDGEEDPHLVSSKHKTTRRGPKHSHRRPSTTAGGNPFNPLTIEEASNPSDEDFSTDSAVNSSSLSEDDGSNFITNEEVSAIYYLL